MRVLIALEHPGTRQFVKGIVQEENDTVIVGQADNVARALLLARKLRPDLAIIDCFLPHTVGLDNVPLSRTGGLDAAQAISEEIPNTRVMLLNNLEEVKVSEYSWSSDTVVSFAREAIGNSIPLYLRDLSNEPKNGPVFARVEVKTKPSIKQKSQAVCDTVNIFGGALILSGLIMMFTLILMVPGIMAASVGLLMVLMGLSAKVVLSKLTKKKAGEPRCT
jgi:CheY-like chemotaxis protein